MKRLGHAALAAVLAGAVGATSASGLAQAADNQPGAVPANAAPPAAVPGGAMPDLSRHPVMPGHPGAGGNEQGGQRILQGRLDVDRTQKFNHFRVGDKNVKSILVDGDVTWVGTSGGVVRYDTKTDEFKMYDATNGLLSNGVFHVGKLHGRVAVGTYGGGLSIFDAKAKKWETFNIMEGLGDAFVYDFLELKNGDIWIATWSGANRVKGGALHDRSKWELYTVENTQGGLPNDWVYGLAAGKNGEVWLATEGGLARYVEGKWENWNHAKGLGADYDLVKDAIDYKNDPSQQSSHHAKQKQEMGLEGVGVAYNPNYVISLAADGDGTVWAGTWGGGLGHFDGTKWKNYTVADGLPGNHVFMLHRDRKGRLWAGTGKGLARVNKDGKFSVLTTDDGLVANAVFSLAVGSKDDLWVGSYGGVAHIRNLAKQ
jgi:ligand-binding sensor domain-containing protein